jgi:hypothetical protein
MRRTDFVLVSAWVVFCAIAQPAGKAVGGPLTDPTAALCWTHLSRGGRKAWLADRIITRQCCCCCCLLVLQGGGVPWKEHLFDLEKELQVETPIL